MRRMMLLLGAVALGVALAVGTSGAGNAAGSVRARWAITDLGTLGGGFSDAVASTTEPGRCEGREDAPHWEFGSSG